MGTDLLLSVFIRVHPWPKLKSVRLALQRVDFERAANYLLGQFRFE